MSNCPCVPYGKKCVYEEHAKNLLGCSSRILNYRLQELNMELPLIGYLFKPYVCEFFIKKRGEEMNYKDYINIPMQENDAGAKTIGEYFEKLLLTLWDEQDGFSGKRPFGNSGWDYEICAALISAGAVDGKLDEDGYVDDVDYSAVDDIAREIIHGVFNMNANEEDYYIEDDDWLGK